MKKKLNLLFITIVVTLFLLISSAQAHSSGYFFKGAASGFQKGLWLGLKAKELKLKKEELELQKKYLELLEELAYLQEESNKINYLLNLGMKQSQVTEIITFDLIYQDNSQIIFNNEQNYLLACSFLENQLIAWNIITSKRDPSLFGTLIDIAEGEKEKALKEEKRKDYYTPFKSSYLDQLKGEYSEIHIEKEQEKQKKDILRYNPFQNSWQYTTKNDVLKYNVFENKWEYTEPESKTKYNPFEDKWEFAIPEDKIKYNIFEDKWSYESKDSTIKYNPFENKWEYAKPDSKLIYNPLENVWGYD